MINLALIALGLFDLAIIALVIFLNQKKTRPDEVLREIIEEKKWVLEMSQNFDADARMYLKQAKDVKDQVLKLATDIEFEVKSCSDTFRVEAETVLEAISGRIDQPWELAKKRYSEMERLLDLLKKEKKELIVSLKRAQVLSKFINQGADPKKLLEELEETNLKAARFLVTQGRRPDDIAFELGMNPEAIRMLLDTNVGGRKSL